MSVSAATQARIKRDNPRQLKSKKHAKLKNDLEKYGDISGVVYNVETGATIGGNMRSLVFNIAECEFEFTHVNDEPDEQGTLKLGYVIWKGQRYNYREVKWNKFDEDTACLIANIGAGEFDWEGLAAFDAEVLNLAGMDEDMLKVLENDERQLRAMLEAEKDSTTDSDAEPEIDRAAELQEKWQTATGQLWAIGEHRLLCGDSTVREDVERVMGGEKAGACVTDSPYGINREGIENDDPEGLRALFDGVLSAMPIDNGVIINFQSPRLFPVWLDAVRAAGHKFERMLWMYKPSDVTFPWQGWLLTSEAILVSTIGKGEFLRVDPFAHDCYSPTTIGKELDKNSGWHASVKPIKVVNDLVARVGGVVFEPFAGSGTTLVACQNLSRQCRSIEISPAYCAVILERMFQAFGITGELIE